MSYYHATWIWEVYSGDIISDEVCCKHNVCIICVPPPRSDCLQDWSEELNDLDLKLIELRESLTQTINDTVAAAVAPKVSWCEILHAFRHL